MRTLLELVPFFKNTQQINQIGENDILACIERGELAEAASHIKTTRPSPSVLGKYVAKALVTGHYLFAHRLLNKNTPALFTTQVPKNMPSVPYATHVSAPAQAAGLRSTFLLWQLWQDKNAPGDLKQLSVEVILLIARYLQPYSQASIRTEQRNALLYYGYSERSPSTAPLHSIDSNRKNSRTATPTPNKVS